MLIRFNVNTREHGKIPVWGYPLPDSEGCPFHLVMHFRTWEDVDVYKKVVISDFESGSVIGHGEDIRSALKMVQDAIDKHSTNTLVWFQKRHITRYGAANRLEDWK